MSNSINTLQPRGELGATSLALGAILGLLWTVATVLSGGFRFHVADVVVSSRGPLRPALITAALYAASLVVAGRGRRDRAWALLRNQVERWSPGLAVGASAAVLAAGVAFGARAVGGPDSFGYVSQAYLWLNGGLRRVEPLAAVAPWPHPTESVSPLAYQAGSGRATIVPKYPPGLPLLMAASDFAVGAMGPYLVGPIAGGFLVLLTFGLAWRLTRDRLTSALASVFMAAAPAFLFNVMAPMSDIPAAALWVAALFFLTFPGMLPAAAAGAATSAAVLVRPNLGPLAAAAAMGAVMWPGDAAARRRPLARVIMLGVGAAAAFAFVLLVNDYLYGSPLVTGYGRTSALFSTGNVAGNVARYAGWLVESQGWAVLLALPPCLVRQVRPKWLTMRSMLPVTAFAGTLIASYLLYLHFDGWWFLRFLLPAFPFLCLLMASSVASAVRRPPAALGIPVLLVTVTLLVHGWVRFCADLGAFAIGSGEQRFIVMAEYVNEHLPPNAVLLSELHSGSIPFYTGLAIVRYQALAGPRLPSALEWLRANGYHPFILLEGTEENDFRQRFAADAGPVGRLEVPVVAEIPGPIRVRLFDPEAPDGVPTATLEMPSTPRYARPSSAWAKRPL